MPKNGWGARGFPDRRGLAIAFRVGATMGVMKIRKLIWNRDRLNRDGVLPEEVEETCFGNPFVQKAKSEGEKRHLLQSPSLRSSPNAAN